MKYENLKPTLADQVKWLLDQANKTHTVPHGVKTVNPGEGLQLLAEDGSEIFWDWSTAERWRADIDAGAAAVEQGKLDLAQARADLDAAQGRIDNATLVVEAAQETADAAKVTAESAAQRLTTVDTRLTATAGELTSLKGTVGQVQSLATSADQRASSAVATANSAAGSAKTAMDQYSSLNDKLTAALAANPGLVTDSSFELVEQWEPAYGAKIEPSSLARSGGNVLRLPWQNMNTATGKSVHAYSRQAVDIVQGHKYRLTAYLRGAQGDTATGNFVIRTSERIYLANTGFQNLNESGVNGTGWVMFQADWEAKATASVNIGFQARNLTDDLLVDDLQGVDATAEASLQLAVADAKREAEDAAAKAVEAQRVAGMAQSAASGKNTITTTTAAPSQVGLTTGDTHLRVTSLGAGGLITGQWRWDGSKWVDQRIDGQFIANLDVGKLTGVFADFSQYVKAGSIYADLLSVGVGQNLVPNGGGEAREGWEAFGHNSAGPASNNGYAGSFWVQGRKNLVSAGFPVTPGEYAWNVSVKGQHTGGRVYIQLICMDRTGSATGSPYLVSNALIPNSSNWSDFSGDKLTIPPGTVKAKWMIYAQHPNGTVDETKYQWFTGFRLAQLVKGDIVANGTIKGTHIEGQSVAAEVAKFIKVKAESVEVTEELSARIARLMTAEIKNLVVTESAILQHSVLLGTTVAEQINLTGPLIGRDAIFDGTVDLAQLNVTGVMSAEIVRMMDATAKRLVVTEDAILNRATVVQDLVTGKLISEKAEIGDLAARMVSGGLIQTSTSANRGVKINTGGIRAWNGSGTQTVDINGSNNFITGRFSTATSGQRVTMSNSGNIAALDLYASKSTSDHVGIWYDSPDANVLNAVGRVLAISGSSYTADSPGLQMWPMRGTFGFQGRWAPDTNATKFTYFTNYQGLSAGAWRQLTLSYQSPFPSNNSLRFPFVSAESSNGADLMVTILRQTTSGVEVNLINKSNDKATGVIVVRVAAFNLAG